MLQVARSSSSGNERLESARKSLQVAQDFVPVWVLVSEPGLLKVLGDLGRTFKFILRLKPGSNIV